MSTQIHQTARDLVNSLITLGATQDKISASRAAMAKLRQAILNPILAAPYVAPFTENLNERQEDCFYLIASLFALNPNHQSGVSFGGAFKHLREKSDGMDKRFSMILGARQEQLPDLIRHGIRLLATESLALDWEKLLLDLLYWDTLNKSVQRKWARDYYRHSEAKNSEKVEGDESL